MLHLISDNGKLTTPSIIQQDSSTPAISKCLRFIRNVLQMNAKMSTFESSSTSFQLLNQMAQTQPYIEFRGKIFIPISTTEDKVWGFLEIDPKDNKPTPVKLRKAIQAVQDMIEPSIISEDLEHNKNSSMLILGSSIDSGHRMSTNLFYGDKYTSFINLSEWILQDQEFSLKSIREFSGSLLFVPEVLDLTPHQRAVLALYSLLPDNMKNSSLIVCTKWSFEELSQKIINEQRFLNAFSNKKTPFDQYIKRRPRTFNS